MTATAATLTAAGMSEREARAKSSALDRCIAALGSAPTASFFVPGRIEVLGKHTDYAGGRSLLCAVERGFVVAVRPRDDAIVRVTDVGRGETREAALDEALAIPGADWATYVAVVVRRIARNFPLARTGADVAFVSDLPPASGMSSSAALSIAMFLSLDAVNNLSRDPAYRAAIKSREALADYLGAVENGRTFGALTGDAGVGTHTGSEDQTAILCCRSGFVSRYAFAPVRREGDLALPPTVTFVVAFSGVAAEKGARAQAAYNELSLAVQRIVSIWNSASRRDDRSLDAAVSSHPDAAAQLRDAIRAAAPADFTPNRLLERLDQFVSESHEIIPDAASALARGDWARFGALVDKSQAGAESMLRNQVPESIALVRAARREGAHAASAFGGGFGGSVWALVAAADVDGFVARWKTAYRAEHSEVASRAEFIVTRPGPAAMRLDSRSDSHPEGA
jgi:galactokinase